MFDRPLCRCSLVVTARTQSKCCFRWTLRHTHESSSVTLKTEAASFSETLQQTYRLIRFNNLQDRHLDTPNFLEIYNWYEMPRRCNENRHAVILEAVLLLCCACCLEWLSLSGLDRSWRTTALLLHCCACCLEWLSLSGLDRKCSSTEFHEITVKKCCKM
jgi:hypothetical protein